jgi:hypothetical protein
MAHSHRHSSPGIVPAVPTRRHAKRQQEVMVFHRALLVAAHVSSCTVPILTHTITFDHRCSHARRRCRRWKTKTMAQGHTPARPPIAHAPYRISLCASPPTQQQQQLARCIQVMCSASAACRRWNAQEAHTLVCFRLLSNTMIACADCVDGVDARGAGCRDGCRVSYLPWPRPKMVSLAQHHPPVARACIATETVCFSAHVTRGMSDIASP